MFVVLLDILLLLAAHVLADQFVGLVTQLLKPVPLLVVDSPQLFSPFAELLYLLFP